MVVFRTVAEVDLRGEVVTGAETEEAEAMVATTETTEKAEETIGILEGAEEEVGVTTHRVIPGISHTLVMFFFFIMNR